MHIFNNKEAPKHLLTPDIVNMLSYCQTTIERTLKELLESGFVEKVGKGRATGYVRK